MANNQSQSPNSSKSQTGSSKPQTHSSSSQTASTSSSPSSASTAQNFSSSANASTNAGNNNADMIEQTIAKGVTHLLQALEPQLNRIGTQIVNRTMSRGQNLADTGVKRMQDQPWYMVGGAIALVAVGIGLLFAFDADSSRPDFSSNNIQ